MQPSPWEPVLTALPTSRRAALWTAACAAALVLPFAGKPLHVDDPLFVWVAQQIAADPLDFFGAAANWFGADQTLADVSENPPLLSYYLALWAALFGWSEVSLHVGYLGPTLALVLGVRALAARWTARPDLAALAAFTTPAVLVSATTLMSDVPMLALYVFSLYFWVRGVDEARGRDRLVAAALIGLATLTKYFAITALPLAACYALAARRPARQLLPLLLPVAVLVGYEVYTWARYGEAQMLAASHYALVQGRARGQGSLLGWALGIAYAGGCAATLLALVPFATTRRERALATGLAALAAGAVVLLRDALPGSGGASLPAHVAAFSAAAVALGVAAAGAARSRPDRVTLLLLLWLGGSLVFALALNWTTNARALMPMVPPLALLLVRRVDSLAAARPAPRPWAPAGAVAAGAALSLMVAVGDLAMARAAREIAVRVHAQHANERVWFLGHWGFQHYMQQHGAHPVDFRNTRIAAGDLLVTPRTGSGLRTPPPGAVSAVRRSDLPLTAWAATLSAPDDAGFYATIFGPLPYKLGPPLPATYYAMRARRAFSFLPPRGTWWEWAAEHEERGDFAAVLRAWDASGGAAEVALPALRACYALGDRTRASSLAKAAVRDAPPLHRTLARVAIDADDAGTAVSLYRYALQRLPERAATLNDLAWLLATEASVADPDEAIALAERARALAPEPEPNLLETLGVAYAAAGRRDDAARVLAEASALAEARGERALAEALRARAAALPPGADPDGDG